MSLLNKQVKCPGCGIEFFARTNYTNKVFEEKSSHQVQVEKFMQLGGQEVPAKPTIPKAEIRKLRAKLILEEALETIHALGFSYEVANKLDGGVGYNLIDNLTPDPIEVVDGCCDLLVVTTGTLSAFGISDVRPVELVDENNLNKFRWTHLGRVEAQDKGYTIDYKYPLDTASDLWVCVVRNQDGKIIKPPSHKPPELLKEIKRQSNT